MSTDGTVCKFHGDDVCMGYGHLVLWLNGAEPSDLAALPFTDPVDHSKVYRSLGTFCTLSSLLAWLEQAGAIPGAKPGDLHARRPGTRGGGDQRPTVRAKRTRMTR